MSRHKKRLRKWMREEAVLVKMEYRHVIQEVILPKSAVGAIIWTDRPLSLSQNSAKIISIPSGEGKVVVSKSGAYRVEDGIDD
jgi:hypothetical protein